VRRGFQRAAHTVVPTGIVKLPIFSFAYPRGRNHIAGTSACRNAPFAHCADKFLKKVQSRVPDRRYSNSVSEIGTGQTGWEMTHGVTGAVFQPELIELMKAVLDDATAALPEAKRTSATKADIASQILLYAAKGERDPIALKRAGLSAVVECSYHSHDISPERRTV
jgi:hypothetical protein